MISTITVQPLHLVLFTLRSPRTILPLPLVAQVTAFSSPSSELNRPESTSFEISKKLNLRHWKNDISVGRAGADHRSLIEVFGKFC